MNNSMKSTGKTVDEAVREALLRMGLRREEVNVKVIQEARGGFLGMGKREAVVEVAKKSGSRDSRGGRSPRSGRDERGERDEARGRSRGGRRRGGEGGEAGGEERDKKREGSRRGSRGGRGRRRGGEDREAGQSQDAAEAKKEAQASRPSERDGGKDDQQDQDQKSGRSRRRGRRSRGGRRRGGARVDEAANGSQQQEAASDERRQDARKDDRGADRDSGRKPGRGSGQKDDRPAAQAGPGEPTADPVEPTSPPAAASPSTAGEEQPPASAAPASAAATGDAASVPDTVAADVPAVERAPRIAVDEQLDEPELLRRTATTLMVKSGFQSRVQVNPGEYHEVKMVVDDRSAGVLIGRQGSTVDAVEHLIERIATHAAGDRVKMNLDINNYRLRREDGLLGQTRRAIQEARATGEPVAMDPAGGRERRIVHLEVAEDEELVTYTEESDDGKQVVICRREQVPARHRDPELHGPAPAGDGDADAAADRAEGSEAAASPQAAEANSEPPADADAPEATGVAGEPQAEDDSPTDDGRERDDR